MRNGYGSVSSPNGGWGPGVVAHGMPAVGPVLVQDEAGGLGVADGFDAEQVVHLAFEAAGRERQVGQAGQVQLVDREPDVELDSSVGWTGDHHVDDPDRLAVVSSATSWWAATSASR